MKSIKNITPPFHGYKDYPVNDEGKILLDRADDGKIVIKRKNIIAFGNGLLALCDEANAMEIDLEEALYQRLEEIISEVKEEETKNEN